MVSGVVGLPGLLGADELRAGGCEPVFGPGRNNFAGVRRQVVFGFAMGGDGTGGNRLNPGRFLYEDASMGILSQTEGRPERGPAMARAGRHVAIRAKAAFRARPSATAAWFQVNRQLSLGI